MRRSPAVSAIAAVFSWRSRWNRYGYFLLILAIAYAALLSAPNLLFAENAHIGAVTVYTHDSATGILPVLQEAEARLAQSPLNDESVSQRIYLTRSTTEFAFYSYRSGSAFGATYTLLHSTFLSPSDPVHNLITSDRAQFNRRQLSAVIAHERMHILLSHHFGSANILFVPAWKQEGYCEYIAGGHSIGDEFIGMRLLRSGTQDPAVAYFRDYTRVRYLIEQKHLTIDQIFQESFDTATLDHQIVAGLELPK